MKKTILLGFVYIMMESATMAASWIDVTDLYIKNANYANNSYEYWEGTPLSGANPMSNAEHYQKTFDTYQILMGLTPGKYRLSLKGYYRAGNSNADYSHFQNDGDNYKYAKLYAKATMGESSVPLVYCSSGATSQRLGGGTAQVDGKYIPNNMEAAHYWFEAGYYDNSVECNVYSDGTLRIGIKKTYTISEDWTCIDSWKLEYYGDVTQVTSIVFPANALELIKGQQYQMQPIITPSNATYKKLIWQSSDEKVATIDENGLLTTKAVGTTTITAKATDGSGVTGTCKVTVIANKVTADNLIINELQVSNLDMFMDPSWNFGPWIELYNPSDKDVVLAGLYVSDDMANLQKYRLTPAHGMLKAKGYATIWFDHYDQYCPTQVNFKLDAEGGTIYIADENGTQIASFSYPASILRCSYARITDGNTKWSWCSNPTPGASNDAGVYAKKQIADPVVNRNGGVFVGTTVVKVTIPEGATLRYTTDGTTPTLTNGAKSDNGSFTFNKTTVYRFRLFQDGMLPSNVVTRSYILREKDYNVPIISVVTDNANIFGADYGILVQGNGNGRSGRGQSGKCNWNMEWDRPVSVEYMPDGGAATVSQEVDMSAVGGWSRAFTPHSFKLKANKIYGLNYYPYPMFENKPYNKNKTLQIRNGGNDNYCRIIDPALQTIVARSGIDVDCQSYKPVFVYFNGKLYDVLNMREPNNKHFAEANFGIDNEEMDQFEYSPDSAYCQMEGTKDMFNQWYELSKNASNDAVYEQIKQIVDIDEFINYMAVEFYIGPTDWLTNSNNIKGYRQTVEGGKFRFVLFDTDSYGSTNLFNDVQNTQWQQLDYMYDTQSSLYKEIELTTIWLNMLNNAEFRKKFIDTFCLVTGSIFNPDRCKEIINELATTAYAAMNQQGGSPWNSANQMMNTLSSNRQRTMINNMKNYGRFNLSSVPSITGTLSTNSAEAKLMLNGMPVPTNKFSGQLFPPVTIEADAPAGYVFKGWSSADETVRTGIFERNTTWKYYDKGSLDGTSWKAMGYNDATWATGSAPLGYASAGSTVANDVKTTLNYGGNANSKYPTYYFRKTIALPSAPTSADKFYLNYTIDDGFVIYVNGVEAGRYNMPSGTPTFNTYASSYAPNNPDAGELEISGSYFKKGENVIAVEVHNNSANSTDIEWAATLESVSKNEGGNIVSTDREYTLPTRGSFNLTAVFEKTAANATAPVCINEISAENDMAMNTDYFKKDDWIELYNTTDEPIDVAGMYLSDDASKPKKFQIPAGNGLNTLIQPHGYLVVWASKRDIKADQIHANFKLSNADNKLVLLTAENGEWADTLRYVTQGPKESVMRYPDGGKKVYHTNMPTIAKSNFLTSYSKFLYTYQYNAGIKGDANSDGMVNVNDITTIATYILNGSAENFNFKNADVNEDGVINVNDITGTAEVILKR